jgi:uncharacterized membrane protein
MREARAADGDAATPGAGLVYRHGFLVRAALLLGPVVVTALAFSAIFLLAGSAAGQEALKAGAASLFIGTAVILGPAVIAEHGFKVLSTWDLVVLVAYANIATGFFYAYNLDLLERLPRIGPWLHTKREEAVGRLRTSPWIRRWATFGVGFFVLLPLPGSGSFGGCIIGRLVGLSRLRSFVTVSIAGLIVCVAYGWFGRRVETWADENEIPIPVRLAVALAFLGLIWLVGRWIARRGEPAKPPSTVTGG